MTLVVRDMSRTPKLSKKALDLMSEIANRFADIETFAATCYPIEGARDVIMIADHTMGATLPNGLPSGVGGHTRFGVAWFMEWKNPSAPIALYDSMSEARYLYALLSGEEGELWKRRQRKIAKIAELEAAEAAAAAEAKAEAKAAGGGSSRPSRSSVKHTASSGQDASPSAASPTASKATSSRRSSSSEKSVASSHGSTGRTTRRTSIARA